MSLERLDIQTDIQTGDGVIPILALDALYRKTKYGQILLDRSRWGGTKPLNMCDAEYQRILGVDANNMKHLQLSYGLGLVFLTYCENPPAIWGNREVSPEAIFTKQDQHIFMVGTVDHDWGEPIVGDIAQPNKTASAEYIEFQHLLDIANSLTADRHHAFGVIYRYSAPLLKHTNENVFRSIYSTLNRLTHGDRELFGVIYQSVDQMLLRTDTKLAKAFNAFEYAGYLRTGLIAWKKSKDVGDIAQTFPDISSRLQGIAFSVATHNIADLVGYAKVYPPIFLQLVANAPLISEIYATPPEAAAKTLYAYQNKRKVAVLEEKFARQQLVWNEWREAQQDDIDHWSLMQREDVVTV